MLSGISLQMSFRRNRTLVPRIRIPCTQSTVAAHNISVLSTVLVSYSATIAIEMASELDSYTNVQYADTSELRVRSGYAHH